MADIADLTAEREEQAAPGRDAAIHQRAASRELQPKGCCHNCDETLPIARALFCDDACRDDWQKRDWAKRQRPEAA